MLYGLILTLLVIDGLLLAVVVLLQAGQGGGLASLGGGTTDLVLGGRQAVTLLHTLSWWTGGLFLGLSLVLSLLAPRSAGVGGTDVQQRLRTAPAPVAPAPLNQAPATTPGVTVPPATPPAAAKPNAPANPPATK